MYIDFGTLTALLLLLLLFGIAWFWNDSLHARDRVISACSRLCNEAGIQFLDQTVALSGLRLQRAINGGLQFARRYAFEFSETGTDRWQGYALLSGSRVDSVQLHGPHGVTILNSASPSVPTPQSSTALDRDRGH